MYFGLDLDIWDKNGGDSNRGNTYVCTFYGSAVQATRFAFHINFLGLHLRVRGEYKFNIFSVKLSITLLRAQK